MGWERKEVKSSFGRGDLERKEVGDYECSKFGREIGRTNFFNLHFNNPGTNGVCLQHDSHESIPRTLLCAEKLTRSRIKH